MIAQDGWPKAWTLHVGLWFRVHTLLEFHIKHATKMFFQFCAMIGDFFDPAIWLHKVTRQMAKCMLMDIARFVEEGRWCPDEFSVRVVLWEFVIHVCALGMCELCGVCGCVWRSSTCDECVWRGGGVGVGVIGYYHWSTKQNCGQNPGTSVPCHFVMCGDILPMNILKGHTDCVRG